MTSPQTVQVFGPTPLRERPATLEDVARVAGVSRQTVSNAVNAPHLLRPETLARVSAAVDRLDYRPNAAARAMRTGRAGVVALRVGGLEPSDVGTTGHAFLAAFAEAARGCGRAVVGLTATDVDTEACRYTELVAGLGLDGVLVAHDGDSDLDVDPRLRWLGARRVRGVLVGPGDGRAGGPFPRVDVDLALATRRATNRMVELGHRRIACVGPAAADAVAGPAAGWAAGMTAAGLPTDGLRVTTDTDLAGVRAAVARVLARPSRPSALVCAGEVTAAAAHAEVSAWGLTVGDDVAVVGTGDGLALQALDVATLAVPAATLADACLDLLLQRPPVLADPDAPVVAPVVHLVPELVARRSFGSPADRGEL